MNGHSEEERIRQLRQKIIGLGETSISKSYYPELRHKLDELEVQKHDLEEKNLKLQRLMGELEEERRKTSESEALYRAVVENIQDVFYRSDKSGNLIMASPSFLSLLGYSSLGDCLGKPIADSFYFFPEMRKELLIQIQKKGRITDYEVVLKKKDGSPIVVETSSHLYRDETGNIAGVEGVFRNVTERKRHEKELRDALSRMKEMEFIINHSPAVIWLWRAEEGWPVEYVSDNVVNLGYMPEDFTSGRVSYTSLIYPEDAERFSEEVIRFTKQGKNSFTQEYRIIIGNGETRWVDDRTWVRRSDNGEVTHYQGIIVDITDRKLAEEALRSSENTLRAIVDGSPIPQFVVDKEHHIIYWNRALEEYSGIRSEDVVGTNQHWRAFYDHERPCMADLLVDNALSSINHWYEGKYNRSKLLENAFEAVDFFPTMKDGIWLYFTAALMVADDGNIQGAVETLVDITEQKHGEEALRLNAERLATLLKINQMGEAPIHDILEYTFEEAVRLTRSEIGYLGFVNESETEMEVQVWSRNAMKECETKDKTLGFSIESSGLWGEAIRQRKPIITNNYNSPNPLKKGYPEGHIAIVRHMNVPIISGGRIVLIAGVGNKKSDYDEDDVRQLALLMEGLWRIIERNRADQELRDSQRRLSDIISFLPDATFVIDRSGCIIAWNRAIEKMTGVKAEEVLGKGDYEYALPFYRDRRPILIDLALNADPVIEKKYATIQREEDVIFGESFVTGLSGGVAYLSGTASVLRDSKGEKIAAIECIRDNTKQKKAESDLRASEEKFRSLYQYTPDCMFFIRVESDESYLIDDINPAGENWLRIKNADIKGGKRISEILSSELSDKLEANCRHCLEAGGPCYFEEYYAVEDGTQIFDIDLLPLRDDEGIINQIFGIGRDITTRRNEEAQRKKLEVQLAQAQRIESIGRLAGGVAHDFNNMLTPIMGYAELLKNDIPLDDPRQDKINEIIHASERSRDLVRQLLAFARKQTLEMKHIDLNMIIKGFESMLRRTIHENINIEIHLAPKLGLIMADVGQIEQIIMNLAINAQDAMPEGGTLFIETSEAILDELYTKENEGIIPGQYIRLSVCDTGAGIDSDLRDRIFEPFFTTKEGKGTGLGLATVYGIVKQHRGHISLYSELGKGTEFHVYLPWCNELSPQVSIMVDSDSTVHGDETIIVVEDQEQVRNMTAEVLNKNGYHVLTACSMKTALEMTAHYKGEISLLITDVILPDCNGRDLHKQLSDLHHGLRVLYMSGYTSDVISHHGVLEPGMHFIHKPFSLSVFVRKVREVLDS